MTLCLPIRSRRNGHSAAGSASRPMRPPWSALALAAVLATTLTAAAGGEVLAIAASAAAADRATGAIDIASTSEWDRIYPENTMIVGVIINGIEAGNLEVIPDGELFIIPLKAFAEISGCSVELSDGSVLLVTPLGAVELTPDDLVEIRGTIYVTEEAIETKLATPVEFDSSEFALVFDLPWRRNHGEGSKLDTVTVAPEATPPAASISTLRSDIFFTDLDDRSFYSTSTVADGRLAGGRWRIRYLDDLAGGQTLREYAWLRTFDRNLMFIGQQTLNLHPVLQSFELTGYQHAWTNQPLDLYYVSPEPRELLPRRLQPSMSFRGPGPPGGWADLQIDGIFISRQPIGLDGTYEFLDVPLVTRQLSTIDVYVYDRHNPAVPVAIHQQTQPISEYMLGRGAIVHMGGIGRGGNFFQDLIDQRLDSEFAGFYQWRWGMTDNLTLEAAAQEDAGHRQVMGGFVARLFGNTVVSLGAGVANGRAIGYDLNLEHYQARRRILARSQIFQPGYRSDGSLASHDHYLEIGYAPHRNLDVSLIGRSRGIGPDEVDYILPALSWWPDSRLSLRARPDALGDYRFDLFYRFGRTARLTVSHQDRTFTDLSVATGRRTRLSLGGEHGGGAADQYHAILSWNGKGRRQPSFNAGLLWAHGKPGFRTGGQVTLAPGILGRIDVESDPATFATIGRRSTRLVIGANVDLAFARGRVVPAGSFSQRGDRGAIAGKVMVDAPIGFTSYRLNDLVVLVNGQPAGRTVFGGTYFIGGLQPGIYRVTLDTENLPLELVPVDATVVVEVAASAVTSGDLRVRPEFGIAGRLVDAADRAVAGALLEIIDGNGSRVGVTSTDQFGLYRFDGLGIGAYSVRPVAGSFPEREAALPSIDVEITNDFLFGQDLQLPFEPAAQQ